MSSPADSGFEALLEARRAIHPDETPNERDAREDREREDHANEVAVDAARWVLLDGVSAIGRTVAQMQRALDDVTGDGTKGAGWYDVGLEGPALDLIRNHLGRITESALTVGLIAPRPQMMRPRR